MKIKIHHKLLAAFSLIAMLSGAVAIYSLNATRHIIQSFEGGEQHFRSIIKGANETVSFTNMAEAHLLLYAFLHDPADRDAFSQQLDTLEMHLQTLDLIVNDPKARNLLERIRFAASQLRPAGMAILQTEPTGDSGIDIQNTAGLIRTYYKHSKNTVDAAAALSNYETDFLNKQLAIATAAEISKLAKQVEGDLMLYLALHTREDLQNYLAAFKLLTEKTIMLSSRLHDPQANQMMKMILAEAELLGAASNRLMEGYHTAKAADRPFDLAGDKDTILALHNHASAIRQAGLGLATLMTDSEYEKKTAALQTANTIQTSIYYLVILGGFVVLFIGFILSRTIAKPITKLQQAAIDIGRGKLDISLDISDKSDLGDLAKAFLNMASELRTTQKELLDSKNYTDNILTSMSDALLVFSPAGNCIRANRSALDLLDYDEADISALNFAAIFSNSPPLAPDDLLSLSRQSMRSIETSYRSKGGRDIPVSLSMSIMHDDANNVMGIVCVAQDITERKLTVAKLNLFATVMEQTEEGIAITDRNGNLIFINQAFEKMTGYQGDEIIGHNMRFLKSGRHQDDFYRSMWNTILSGEAWKGHFINKRKDGSLYEEDCHISPVRNDDGSISNFVALKRDVTLELRMERQIQMAQRHEALGTLAGGIAHDFNNILTAIMGYAALSASTVPKDSKIYSHLQKIIKGGGRAADLVNQILTFSRQTGQEKKPIQLQPLVKEALKLLRGTLPTTIEIRQEIDMKSKPVLADPTQIHQMIMNLCTNAFHAMRETGGVLLVRLHPVILEQDLIISHMNLVPPGKYTCLVVSDSGHGMEADTLEKIFEPYFTTKKADEGTGLGLSTVHGIVNRHDGKINVTSKPGIGTTFEIYFPVTSQFEPVMSEKDGAPLPSLSGRILFVDDEENIVVMAQDLLEQTGCQVVATTSSIEALTLFQADPASFDALITDQTMPKMTGYELASKVLELRPELPIILCTGYSETVNEQKAFTAGIRAFMMKPLDMGKLAHNLQEILPRS